MSTDMYGFRDDLVEIVARVIDHKDQQAKGVSYPNTDDWLVKYNGGRAQTASSQLRYNQSISYNYFRAEVDGTVGLILNTLQRRQENLR